MATSHESPPSHLNTMETSNETQGSPSVVDGHKTEGYDGDSPITNLRLLKEVKTLQLRLLELEREARPRLDAKALAAEWEHAKEELGSEEEMKAWKEEKRQRKAKIVAARAGSHPPESHLGHGSHDTPQRTFDEEFEYSLKLFKLRKQWERRISRAAEPADSDSLDDSDCATDMSPDALHSDYRAKRAVIQQDYNMEMRALENEFRRRKLRLQKLQQAKENVEVPPHSAGIQAVPPPSHVPPPPSGQLPVHNYPVHVDPALQTPSVSLDVRPNLARVDWEQFKALRSPVDRHLGPLAAIDVLVEEPAIEFTSGSTRTGHLRWIAGRRGGTKGGTSIPKTISVANVPVKGEMPERIRINSRHLLDQLYIVCYSGTSDYAQNHGDFKNASLVLLRPFRILACYNRQIRALCAEFKGEPSYAEYLDDGSKTTSAATGVNPELDQEEPTGMKPSPDAEAGDSQLKKNQTGEEASETLRAQQERNRQAHATALASARVASEHLRLLVEFMDTDLQTRISYLESDSCQKVAFSDLWYFFQPGSLVIRNDGKQAYRVLRMRSVAHRVIDPLSKWTRTFLATESEEGALIEVTCVYLDFDGKQLGPVSKVFQISKFDGEKSVTTLDIYPLRFHPFRKIHGVSNLEKSNITELKDYLIDRGRRFLNSAAVGLADIQPMYYAGPELKRQEDIEGHVVVDFEAAFGIEEHVKNGWKPTLETLITDVDSPKDREENQSIAKHCQADCCIGEPVHDDSYVELNRNAEFMRSLLPKVPGEMPAVIIVPRTLNEKAPTTGLAEDDLIIMSYRVFGFVLRNRRWAQLDLTYLSDAQPSGEKSIDDDDTTEETAEGFSTAFDDLVLPPGHKDMILSLVTQHLRDKEAGYTDQADIVRGKGKGLILLLHGAPGVGKTTTAEGVAEKFKKPLFQLTCGDLGTTAKEVESALETNFALASRWRCVLLLDEADVFLAQRTKEDFKRNGLVAVFLRVLEYYSGILFLTTNRVGDFDEAFASRIHISLYYPELGKEETMDVFRLNLKLIANRFTSQHRKFVSDDMGIGSFIQNYYDRNPFDRWNGRQIRNACQTAVALAEFEAQGKNHRVALNPNAEVHLNASHFETVARSYLAFSEHLKDIYGTHAARRAKEAGLRAMWVSEKGDIIGSVGPKEAGILKADRKSRFKQKAQGRLVTAAYEQHQQVAGSRDYGLPYGGSQGGVRPGGGQSYGGPPTRLTGPRMYYDDPSIHQQYNTPGPQVPRGPARPEFPNEPGWEGYSAGHGPYEWDRQHPEEQGGREAYPQQPGYLGSHHPKN